MLIQISRAHHRLCSTCWWLPHCSQSLPPLTFLPCLYLYLYLYYMGSPFLKRGLLICICMSICSARDFHATPSIFCISNPEYYYIQHYQWSQKFWGWFKFLKIASLGLVPYWTIDGGTLGCNFSQWWCCAVHHLFIAVRCRSSAFLTSPPFWVISCHHSSLHLPNPLFPA